MQLISWKSGWKTYAVCGIAIASGIYDATTGHQMPGWVDFCLNIAGFGGSAMRNAIETRTAAVIDAVMQLKAPLQAALMVPTLGQPSPSVQTSAEEEAETANLNRAQASK